MKLCKFQQAISVSRFAYKSSWFPIAPDRKT